MVELSGRIFGWTESQVGVGSDVTGETAYEVYRSGLAKDGTRASYGEWVDDEGKHMVSISFRWKDKKFGGMLRGDHADVEHPKWADAVRRLERAAEKSLLMLHLYGTCDPKEAKEKAPEATMENIGDWDRWYEENQWKAPPTPLDAE